MASPACELNATGTGAASAWSSSWSSRSATARERAPVPARSIDHPHNEHRDTHDPPSAPGTVTAAGALMLRPPGIGSDNTSLMSATLSARPAGLNIGHAVRLVGMNPTHSEQLGALVQGFATIQGFRQRDLADLLGLAQPSISARLAGRIPFTVQEVATLAAAFDVEPGDLIPPAVTR